MSAKLELEQQFLKLKSEQLPLRNQHQKNSHFILAQKNFEIPEEQSTKAIHERNSKQKLILRHKINEGKNKASVKRSHFHQAQTLFVLP